MPIKEDYKIPKCPKCGSIERTTHSVLNESHIIITERFPYCECLSCGHTYPKYKFKIKPKSVKKTNSAIKLTPDQEKTIESILWLTDPFGKRGSGRTTVLAMVYLQHAIKYESWITLIDHNNGNLLPCNELVKKIESIVKVDFPDKKLKIRKSGNLFEIKLNNKIKTLKGEWKKWEMNTEK